MTNISPIPQVDGLLDFPVGGHVKDQIPANRRQEGSSESEEEEEVPERVQRGRGGARVRARGRGGVAWLGVSGRGSGRVIGRGRCGGRGGARRVGGGRRVVRRPGEPGGSSPWRSAAPCSVRNSSGFRPCPSGVRGVMKLVRQVRPESQQLATIVTRQQLSLVSVIVITRKTIK